MSKKITMEKLVAYAKNHGFVFQGSEIYGGLANSWDYGPIGVELKNNIKRAWWKKFIQESPYNVGLDSAIIMNPKVWEASGHLGNFSDPLIDCKECKSRHRADKLIEDYSNGEIIADGWTEPQMTEYIKENKISCPNCGESNFTDIRQFELMYKTYQGVVQNETSVVYLRPETCQGIFSNFNNVQRSMRKKLPFGIGQVGKSFRNEITPGNFIFRTREFEQMELEFFCKPGEDEKWYKFWQNFSINWLYSLGLSNEHLRIREHSEEELSHYSKGTSDIEFSFPMGWGELWGIANRTDFDLKAHMTHSKTSFEYQDPTTNEKYVPYCIEPSVGVGRLFLAFLIDAYVEETLGDGETREVLRLHPALAPYKVAVLPLVKKLDEQAFEVFEIVSKHFTTTYDITGKIGKRYRRQDAIGTPYCVTFDYDSLEDNCVTVRDRDSMEQVRIPINELVKYISEKVDF